jgi:hypothetical protein
MNSALRHAVRFAGYAWAAPNSLLGLILGLFAMLLGASARVRSGALEFGGGGLGRAVSRLPTPVAFSAITFGHVILGIDTATLAAVRAHEQVHVRQYERWGPVFLPAYLVSSLWQLLRGRDPYRENHFEREAYAKASSMTAGSNPAIERAHSGLRPPPSTPVKR